MSLHQTRYSPILAATPARNVVECMQSKMNSKLLPARAKFMVSIMFAHSATSSVALGVTMLMTRVCQSRPVTL
eukprot:1112794-Amphidinium_carterae.1